MQLLRSRVFLTYGDAERCPNVQPDGGPMNQSERGKENLETINDRNDERVDQASRTSNGEAAGGVRDDVPGGAYNVPPGI